VSEAENMMGLQTSKMTRVEVRQWWIAVKTQQERFFHLVSFESLVTMKFRNIGAVIQQLEADYRQLHETEFPESADTIRGHLLHAMEHVLDSLFSLSHQQLFESDIRYNIAQVDMTMLKHELLEHGITD
jgi:hypothetical protein